MRSAILLASCVAPISAVQAQPAVPSDTEAEQTRLETLRATETTRLNGLDAQCYQRFEVNRCLREVQRERIAVFNAIRQQEQALNATARARAAQAQQDALTERLQERAAKEREMLQTDGPAQAAARLQAQQDKQRSHAESLAVPSSTPASGPKGGSADAARQAQSRAAYDKKQQDALQRRADLEKRLQEKGPAKPSLPLPP